MKVTCIFVLFVLHSALAWGRGSADAGGHQLTLSTGPSGIFDTEHNLTFVAEYRHAWNWKGVHPWLGLSWATDGAVFAGGGALYSLALADGTWQLTAGIGPGYYERHEGADLGSHLEICTFGEISRNTPWGHRVMFRLMHISNGGLTERNPGNELLLLGYAIPLP